MPPDTTVWFLTAAEYFVLLELLADEYRDGTDADHLVYETINAKLQALTLFKSNEPLYPVESHASQK